MKREISVITHFGCQTNETEINLQLKDASKFSRNSAFLSSMTATAANPQIANPNYTGAPSQSLFTAA